VIKKHPPSREISATDSFSFNVDFTTNLTRIRISSIARKVESQEERKETTERIEEGRKHQTDVSFHAHMSAWRYNVTGSRLASSVS
jgi:cullin 3